MNIGDKVILNSGGPSMIVESVKDQIATVVWLDKRLHKRTETFPVAGLTKLTLGG